MISTLLQVERDRHDDDHYSHQTLNASVIRHYLYRGICSTRSCGVTVINIYYLHTYKVSIPVFIDGILILIEYYELIFQRLCFLSGLFGFQIFWLWPDMLKVIPDSRCVYLCINRGLLLTRKASQHFERLMVAIIIGQLLQNICITDDHGYVPLVMDTLLPFYLFLHLSTNINGYWLE